MKNRCYNPKVRSYKDYGGRGITVCSEWQHDFKAFYDWAMQAGYDPDAAYGACTLDRIAVDGNYEPQNCRWVDMKVQSNNKRKKKGETHERRTGKEHRDGRASGEDAQGGSIRPV